MGGWSARRKASTCTQTQKNAHTLTLNIHAFSGIRTHDPSFRASEDRSATVTGNHTFNWNKLVIFYYSECFLTLPPTICWYELSEFRVQNCPYKLFVTAKTHWSVRWMSLAGTLTQERYSYFTARTVTYRREGSEAGSRHGRTSVIKERYRLLSFKVRKSCVNATMWFKKASTLVLETQKETHQVHDFIRNHADESRLTCKNKTIN
jgi:hypothetical protein